MASVRTHLRARHGRVMRSLIPLAAAVAVATCTEPTAPSALRSTNPENRALLTGIGISPANDTALVGQTITLAATGAPSGKPVTWKSSDSTVARVVASGATTAAVTGVTPGTVTISASASGKSGTATVRVLPVPVRSVKVAPDSAAVQLGDSAQFSATARDSSGAPLSGRTIVWSTPDTSIATVSPNGLARARAHGRARIRATVDGVIGESSFIVSVPELSVPSMTSPDSANAGDTLVIRYSIQNLGDAPIADSVVTRIGLRSNATGAIVRATRRAAPRIPSLAIGSDSARMVVPATPPGAYTVVVYADCVDAGGTTDEARLADCLANPATAGAIRESSENNNVKSLPLVVRGPQLTAISVVAADTVMTRTTTTTAFAVTNAGSATTTGFDVIVGLYDVTTGSVMAAASVSTTPFGNREVRTLSVPVAIPGGLDVTHQYDVRGYADCTNAGTTPAARLQNCIAAGSPGVIAESNETDNSASRRAVVVSNVARVSATPDTVRLAAVGDTAALTAVAYDRAGALVSGVAVTWTSLDPNVSVTSSGVVRALTRGSARIVAAVEGRADTSIAIVVVPDLSVTTMTASDSVNVGDTLVVRYSVQNAGDTPLADSVIVRVGLQSSTTNAVVRAVRRALPRAAAALTVSDSARFVIPSTAPGSYRVAAFVDCRDVSGTSDEARLADCLASPATAGSISESNESNNSTTWALIVRGPQLTATSLTAKDTLILRTAGIFGLGLVNSGSATATGFDVITGLYDVTAGSVVAAGTTSGVSFGSRETRTVSGSFVIPTVDLTHQFQIRAYADCSNSGATASARLQICLGAPGTVGVIAESNETDNSAARNVVLVSSVARVVATPDTIRFARIGDTTTVIGTAFDRNGATLPAAPIAWASLDAAATVTTTGLVRSVANGSARIVASVDGKADTTIAIVSAGAASVVVSPDTALIGIGGATSLAAVLRDASGVVITSASAAWTSLDPAVAAVSDSGAVSGLSAGLARIVATANGHADTTTIFVNPAGTTHRWLGVTATGWQSADNWYPHAVPGETDSPFVPAGATQQPFLSAYAGVRNLVMAAGATFDLRSFSIYALGNVEAPGTIIGGDVEMRGSGSVSGNVSSLVVRGQTQLGGRTAAGSVSVQDTGRLTIAGHTLVTPSLSVGGSSSIVESNPIDTIWVTTSASFVGTGTSVFSNGILRADGAFGHFGQPGTLQVSGSHTVIFGGAGDQSIVIADTTSGWQNVVVANNGGTVQLQSSMSVKGLLSLAAGARLSSQSTLRFTSQLPNVAQGTYSVATTAVAGAVTLVQPHVLPGTVSVESGATLRLNGYTLNVPETLSIAGGGSGTALPGTVVMDVALDSLIVGRLFSLGGSAQFSAGKLIAKGDITISSTTGSKFAASGTHLTALLGTTAQRLSMSGSTNAFFNDLQIDNAAGVDISGDLEIHGQLRSGSGVVRSSGRSLHVTGGAQIAGLVLDGTALDLAGPRGTIQALNGVTFLNSPAVPALLRIRMDGPGEFLISNLTFPTPVAGTLWVDADSIDPTAAPISFDIASPQWEQGPANTRVGNARVTWRAP